MADTLIDAAKLREEYEIHKDIKDARLTPCIGAASRRLAGWVGETVYADALTQQTEDALRKADLETAEGALAMHFALPRINTNISPKGGVLKTVKVEGNTVNSYLTPAEVKQLSQLYLDQAEEIARPYMLSDGTPEAEFTVVDE